jgi:hypothetical protein
MDDMSSKLRRKLAQEPQEPKVISPADREQRLRQMLGYAQPKDIDPGFAADVPDDSGDDEFGIKEPLDLEPQRPIPGKPGQVDQVARYKKKKDLMDRLVTEPLPRGAGKANPVNESILDRASGKIGPSEGSRGQPLESMTAKSQQEMQEEMDDEFYRQAELLRKQREAMKAPASGLSSLEQQAKKSK